MSVPSTLAEVCDHPNRRIWDLATGELMNTLKGHEDVVWSVAISPDGSTIVSGSEDDTVRYVGNHVLTLGEASMDLTIRYIAVLEDSRSILRS
jgi:WD40 repeat protein